MTLKGHLLKPVLFNIHINDLDAGLEGMLRKFAVCTELGGAVKSLRGREGLQRNLDKSEKWASPIVGSSTGEVLDSACGKGQASMCGWTGE